MTERDVPLNRVSCYGKNYAIGHSFLIKIMRQGTTVVKKIIRQGILWKDIFRVFWQQGIIYTFSKIFKGQGIPLVFFMRQDTGYGEICHAPLSLP